MRPFALAVAACGLVLSTGCGATGDAPAPVGVPLETRAANGLGQTPAFAGQTRAPGVRTAAALAHRVVASGLVHPWALAALPDGRWLVAERPGRLRLVNSQGQVGAPIAGLPPVLAEGQGGLLDVALSPEFAADRRVYWSYVEPRGAGNGTAVARGRLSDDAARLEAVQVIFRAEPAYANTLHFGSRLVFDRQGRLFVTLGERSDTATRPQAQALDSHLGKIIRINADGSVPADNPFVGRAGARPEIWSLGHRNVQGAALDPATGELWATEHGTRGGDEVNIVRAGRNYGWPEVAYGVEYRGGPINEGLTTRVGTEQPVYYWDPVIAPGGAAFYTGAMFPAWRGDLLVAGLKEKHLARLVIKGGRVVGEERLLTDVGERIRDVAVARDGAVWVVTDEDDGKLVRLGVN